MTQQNKTVTLTPDECYFIDEALKLLARQYKDAGYSSHNPDIVHSCAASEQYCLGLLEKIEGKPS